MTDVQILQTPLFLKKKKKLKKNQRICLDTAVREIVHNPEVGIPKKGDLADIWVYKFKMLNQTSMLAYHWDAEKRILITIALHENFYRDIKSYLKS